MNRLQRGGRRVVASVSSVDERCFCRGVYFCYKTEHKCTIKIDGTPRGSGCETTNVPVPAQVRYLWYVA